MNYIDFLKNKQKRIIESGFDVKKLNDHLFDFQAFIVHRSLKAGKCHICRYRTWKNYHAT
jgi:hypothetical protein